MKTRHNCSYCGGFDEEVAGNPNIVYQPETDFLTFTFQEEKRVICGKCVIKGLDRAFGSLQLLDELIGKVTMSSGCVINTVNVK